MPFLASHVQSQARLGLLGERLMAVVCQGPRGRVYLSPTAEHESAKPLSLDPSAPDYDLPKNPRWVSPPSFGLTRLQQLFTPRQLTALTTFRDLIARCRTEVRRDAEQAGLAADGVRLNDGGSGAAAYADAVATYMALAVDKLADYGSATCSWHSGRETTRNTFARQALPMVWDYAEANPFSDSTGNWAGAVDWIVKAVAAAPTAGLGKVAQADATVGGPDRGLVVSTDPPYYDNIGYADLADYFYVWLRRSLRDVYPDLFGTLLTPKAPELVATPYRFAGGRAEAKTHFEGGLHQAFVRLRAESDPAYPLTVYYAFKQADSEEDGESGGDGGNGTASTGWETMLALGRGPPCPVPARYRP